MTDVDPLSLLAHELRSPIAALMAIEETLRLAGGEIPDDEVRHMLGLAAAAGRDIERLVADPEGFSVRLAPVDLASSLSGLRGDRVEVEIEPGLVVDADAVRLRQAVGNLVANGLRHGTRVTVSAREEGGEVLLTVTDDGPGVEPGLDPFAPGVSGAGSTGLGLYVARAVAVAHRGRLELGPEATAGATFTLALPRDADAHG
jgi:signal transduction histidine kinase